MIHILRQAGHEQEAADHAARLLATLAPDSYLRGDVFAVLRRTDEALAQLERVGPSSSALGAAFRSLIWDVARQSLRLAEVLAKLGCMEVYKVGCQTLARMLKKQAGK